MLKKLVAKVLAITVTTTMILGNCIWATERTGIDNKVEDLVKKMTLEEKVGQITQAERKTASTEDVKNYSLGSILSGGGSAPDENTAEGWANMTDEYQDAAMESRLGVPILYGVDAVHGHNNVYGSTIFPHNIGLGATGNTELVKKIGQITAKEMRATGANWTFAPTLGIPHNERWGRTYECFGERSELVTDMGDSYIRGLQGDNPEKTLLRGDKVIGTAKHYIGEGLTEDGSNQGNVVMDEEEFENVLWNELLPPYIRAVEDGIRSVMVSFNSINGVKCHGNAYLINNILKEAVQFKGIVVSDWEGINQINAPTEREKIKIAINAGVDMAMVPDTWKSFISTTISLVNDGEISIDRIDDAVRRILKVKFEMGLFDDPYAQRDLLESVGSEEHREIARQAVRESLVLLKNDNDLISTLKDKRDILVAGKGANDIGIQTGGWTMSWQGSVGDITKGTTILDGIKDSVDSSVKVTYNKNGRASESNDVAIVVISENPYAETDGDRRPEDLTLDKEDLNTIKVLKETNPNIPVVAVLVTGRPITIADQLEDFDAIVAAWLPGTEGNGIAEVLFGEYDFKGKLTMTWPWYAEEIENKMEDGKALFNYGYGLKKGETNILPEKPERPEIEIPQKDPIEIPEEGTVKIEMEDYSNMSGFKFETCFDEGGGENLGWSAAGHWANYYIDVKAEGKYKVEVRVASPDGVDKGIRLLSDNKELTLINMPQTGGWQNWENTEGIINLKEGIQTLTFKAVTWGYNINYFKLTKIGEYEENEPVEIPDSKPLGKLIKGNAVKVWMSSSEEPGSMEWYDTPKEFTNKLSEKEPLSIYGVDNSKLPTINIDPSKEYQSMLGIGTSLEESTINNFVKMDPKTREGFIRKLIDPVNGAGMTLMRVTIGTADFTGQDFYTYYDNAPIGRERDWFNETGKGFSIQKDIDYGIVDTVKQILEIAKELGIEDEIKIFASSWTPPGWMKEETSSSKSYKDNELLLKGGKLSDKHIEDLAKYYTRYLEEYAKLGINIYAMTLQNEPELEIDYPSCFMTPKQEGKIAMAIKKEVSNSEILKKSGVNPKLWAFDHNFSSAVSFMNEAFSINGAYEAIDGIALHDYSGEPTVMSQLKDLYPEKSVNLTERSLWGTSGANRIAQYIRNGSESYNAWVTMLDSNIAPEKWVGTPGPTLFIQDAANRNNYWETPEVYITAQYSRFIRPGFIRIDSNYGSPSSVTNVAFKNPKTGEINLVVINQTENDQSFKIVCEGAQINATLPANNVATYVWNPIKNIKNIATNINATEYDEASGIVNNGDYIGDLKDGAWAEYFVNVNEEGLYNVTYEVASNMDLYNKIDMIQDEEVISTVDVPNTGSLNNYLSVKNTVKFNVTGAQKIKLNFSGSGFSIKNIKIEKAKEVYKVPGRILGENYINSKGVVIGNGFIEGLSLNDYIEYKVDVIEAGEYNLNLWVASERDNSEFELYSNEEKITNIKINNTGGFDKFQVQNAKVTLNSGEQILRLKVINGFNLQAFTLGSAISISSDAIIEGNENTKEILVNIIEGEFNNSLNKENWTLENIPVGVDFIVERLSNTKAKIKLLGNSNEDFDLDKTVNITISSKELVGEENKEYYLEDSFIIKAIDDIESISFEKDEIKMETESFIVTLEGGTFIKENINKITLGGEVIENEYVKIKNIEYIDSTHIKINLEWLKAYYEDLQMIVNISKDAYSDSTNNKNIEKSIICIKSVEEPKLINIGSTSVELEEKDAYRIKGSLKSNVKMGDRLDYYIDIEDAGDYIITYNLWNNSESNNAIKVSSGFGTSISANIASISMPNFWGNVYKIKDTITLQEGKQTLRFEATSMGFEIKSITIEKIKEPQVISGVNIGDKTVIKADSFNWTTRDHGHGIQTSGIETNLGFINKGSYFDYMVDIKNPGIYYVTYNYATDSGINPNAVLQRVHNNSVYELSRTELVKTNGWNNYKYSSKTPVRLESGEQVLRVYVDKDGFNFKDITFEYMEDKIAPVINGKDNLIIELNSEITEEILMKLLEVKVVDNIDGNITNKATLDLNKLDINNIGEYDILVSAIDGSGNKSTREFKVGVNKDITAPIIEGKNGYITVGANFDPIRDLGLKVTDNIDGDIVDKAQIIHSVNTNKEGIFKVSVVIFDTSGNKSEKIFIVRVLSTAVIESEKYIINVGGKFDAMDGVKAYDISGENITSKVIIKFNNVDTTKIGNYIVKYQVVDSEGNLVSFERTIIVEAIQKPEKPLNLKADSITKSTINISWNEPAINRYIYEYEIYLDGKLYSTVAASNTEYEFTGLKGNTIYGIKILAKAIDGQVSTPISINVRTRN